jgi:hypothetical protein
MPGPGPAPGSKPPEKVKAHEVVGLGCCGLVAIYLAFAAYRFFVPPRPLWLEPAVRDARDPNEKAVRAEIEKLGYFGSDVPFSKRVPAKQTGAEPRAGVTLYEVCNFTGKSVDLFFDGVEIFKVNVPPNASVAVELKSGDYDCVKVAWGVYVWYTRTKLAGAYHDHLALEGTAEAKAECRGEHAPARKVP